MTTETSEKLVYTVEEVGRLLGISRGLAYTLCREHKIPGVIECGKRRMVVSVAAINRLLEGDNSQQES